jgi:DNA-binding CsgD family transcriptional regulator/tetratricopeptide (TPR) repeat protein
MGVVQPRRLAGRDDASAKLSLAFAAAASAAVLVTLTGEAGIGKSALIDQFLASIRGPGVSVLSGGCTVVYGDPIPYAPFPRLLQGIGVDAALADAAPESRAALFDRILDAVEGARGRDQMQVLVIEDLHWADTATLELVAFLARNLPPQHLVIATYRSEEILGRPDASFILANLAADSRAVHIRLDRLDVEAVGAVATAITAGVLDVAAVRELHHRSGGNPFLVGELLNSSAAEVPERVTELLVLRTRGLSRSANALTEAAAVIGRPFDDDLVEAVLADAVSQETMTAALEECMLAGVLIAGPGDDEYRFRHVLTQEAVLRRMRSTNRRRLHARIGEILGVRPGTRQSASAAAEWAAHWYASGRLNEAVTAAVVAGSVANGVFAWSESWRLYERAVELHAQLTAETGGDAVGSPGLSAVDLYEQAAEAARLAGRASESVRLARTARSQTTDPERSARIGERLGRGLMDLGDLEAAATVFAEASERVAELPVSQLTARVTASTARLLLQTDRYVEAVEHADRAAKQAASVNAHAEQARALTTSGVARTLLGHLDEGVDQALRAAELAARYGDLEDRRRADGNLSFALLLAGRTRQACETAVSGLATARRYSLLTSTGGALVSNTVVLLRLSGRLTDAEELSDSAIAEGVTDGQARLIHLARAEVELDRGRLGGARHHLAEAWRLAVTRPPPSVLADFELVEAQCLLEQRHYDEAFEAVSRALSALRRAPDRREITRADELALRIAAEQAEETREPRPAVMLDAIRDDAAEQDRGPRLPEAHGYALGAAAEHQRASLAADPAAWHRVVDHWARLERPGNVAYALIRQGEAELGIGRAQAALATLTEANQAVIGLGAGALRRILDNVAGRARIVLSTAPEAMSLVKQQVAGDRFRLTPRERDVMDELARGLTNKQIAARLYLSPRTVGVHVSNILDKLHARTRSEAVIVAIRADLVRKGLD